MIKKLRLKFIAIAMLSVILVLGVLISAMNVWNYHNLVSEADKTLVSIAENKGIIPGVDIRPDDPTENPREGDGGKRTGTLQIGKPDARHDLNAELPFQTRYFIVFYNADGTVQSCRMDHIASIDETGAKEIADPVYASGKSKGFYRSFRYYRTTTENETALFFLSCQREFSTFRSFLIASVSISAMGILAVFALIVLFSARIVRPIAQSYEKQKRFITDAGHELKTPITIIRADVDVLETEIEDSEWLEDIRVQTHRLSSLTNDLIYLSKMEEEGARPERLSFSFSDVVAENVQSFSAVAIASNKKMESQIQPMLLLNGDEKSIRKLISVLMDNALKYSSEHGRISVSLSKMQRQIVLSVSNSVEDIEKGNQDRLFDRFYRSDASRNSETGGFGLGLAIAKAVAESHKGKIHAFSSDGKSLTVEAVFPDS